jgi:hypothetical protein
MNRHDEMKRNYARFPPASRATKTAERRRRMAQLSSSLRLTDNSFGVTLLSPHERNVNAQD